VVSTQRLTLPFTVSALDLLDAVLDELEPPEHAARATVASNVVPTTATFFHNFMIIPPVGPANAGRPKYLVLCGPQYGKQFHLLGQYCG
jgi:hypothetical protein